MNDLHEKSDLQLLIRAGCGIVLLIVFSAVGLAKAPDDLKLEGIQKVFLPKLTPDYSAQTLTQTQTVEFQDRLLGIAGEYTKLNFVPYIWGGEQIGSKGECLSCRECVRKKHPILENRLQLCPPCRQCGIDCSHFVHRIYKDAGLDYDYASSTELGRVSREMLLEYYQMVDIGRDLSLAEPGDILVFSKHIVMLTKVLSPTHGDVVHVTRFDSSRLQLGGLRWDKNRNLHSFRGKLVRILRHKRFFSQPRSFTMDMPTQIERALASL